MFVLYVCITEFCCQNVLFLKYEYMSDLKMINGNSWSKVAVQFALNFNFTKIWTAVKIPLSLLFHVRNSELCRPQIDPTQILLNLQIPWTHPFFPFWFSLYSLRISTFVEPVWSYNKCFWTISPQLETKCTPLKKFDRPWHKKKIFHHLCRS